VQITNSESYSEGSHYIYSTTFLSHDSLITLQKTWYAPADPDTCHFIIQSMRIWTNSQPVSGLTIGEVVDWDIPSDTGVRNSSGSDEMSQRIWQSGSEYNQDDSSECQENDHRYGGIVVLGTFSKPTDWASAQNLGGAYGAYTASNADFVYGNENGFVAQELYTEMQTSGFRDYANPNPDSAFVDLHMVMTFVNNYDLMMGDTFIAYSALVTVRNGDMNNFNEFATQAEEWFCSHLEPLAPPCNPSCCQNRGKSSRRGSRRRSLIPSGPSHRARRRGDRWRIPHRVPDRC